MTDAAVADATSGIDSLQEPEEIVREWADKLGSALALNDAGTASMMFHPDGVFRDLLALGWDLRNAIGRQEITSLVESLGPHPAFSIGLRAGDSPRWEEEGGTRTLTAFLQFRNGSGVGFGYVRLLHDCDAWRAASLVLALDSLDTHPERHHEARISGKTHGPVRDRLSWNEGLDPEFRQQDPEVLILGAGHNGLMLAARLRALGVSAVVVEPNGRVGDNWRNRYSSLALHTPLASDHLPYLPFPSTWPRFTPKDKLGDFLESYATLLDLPVWTASTLEAAEFDDHRKRWSVSVKRGDGSLRQVSPRHLVFATGMNAAPVRPVLPGQADYQGAVLHAVDYQGHNEWRGKRAVVVGSGVSGHDIAQDLAEHGVDVTMVQRSGTFVMNTSTFHKVMHANHVSGKYTTEEADLVNASTPFGALPAHGPEHVRQVKAMDRELLAGLADAGFQLSDGPDGQGVLGLIFGLNGTGYYYNAGASELIVDGTIELRHGSVEGFSPTGVTLDGGRTLDADLVVFATGYHGAPSVVRAVLGDDIADRVGEFAKVGPDREYGRLWRRTEVEQLWFMVSLGIGDGRFYSKLLALQLAAMESGAMPLSEKKQ